MNSDSSHLAAPGTSDVQAQPLVTEADIDAAREYIADVHNEAQMLNACSQLRREVVIELAGRGFVPSFYAA